MDCYSCKGQMEKDSAPIEIDREGWHITIDHSPAWVCNQCGEHLFEEKELDAIQDLIVMAGQKIREMEQ